VDSDQQHDDHAAAPADPQEQHEVAMDRRHLLKRVGLGAAALSVPTAIMANPAMGAVADALAADSFIKSHPKWKFTFVNHVTTNPFFVPTIYGAQDACSLFGCSYQWTGSATSDVSQMVNAFNSAISAKAAGISCCLVDLKAFNGPTANAIGKGIPVLAYNADVPTGNPNERLAYIGQDLYASGYAMGQRIVNLVKEGDVALFIATPGQLNIQPRIDGATAAIKKLSGGKIKTSSIATGSQLNDEIAKIDAYYLGHKNLKGMFAVDAGSTQAVGQTVAKYKLRSKGVKAGGYDLTPTTLKFIQSNQLDFTIDQQPYLQGFLPVLQLFLYRYSSGLVAPSNTNTGILFVTKENVGPYISSKTRYEGSSSAQKYPIS
jgi:simple sugar transport system substrate-binding protein